MSKTFGLQLLESILVKFPSIFFNVSIENGRVENPVILLLISYLAIDFFSIQNLVFY